MRAESKTCGARRQPTVVDARAHHSKTSEAPIIEDRKASAAMKGNVTGQRPATLLTRAKIGGDYAHGLGGDYRRRESWTVEGTAHMEHEKKHVGEARMNLISTRRMAVAIRASVARCSLAVLPAVRVSRPVPATTSLTTTSSTTRLS